MSLKAYEWATRQNVGSSTAKSILWTLASFADDSGRCYPGQDTIAEIAGCSSRAVREWLQRLEAMGLLRRERRRRANGYRTSDSMFLSFTDLPAPDAGKIASEESETLPAGGSGKVLSEETEFLPAGDSPEPFSPETHADLTGRRCRAEPCKGNRSEDREEHARDDASTVDETFATFWAEYPVRKDKQNARKAFTKALKIASFETIMAGLRRYKAELARSPQRKVKWAQGWLSGQRWEDEDESPRAQTQRFDARDHIAQRGGGRRGGPPAPRQNTADAFDRALDERLDLVPQPPDRSGRVIHRDGNQEFLANEDHHDERPGASGSAPFDGTGHRRAYAKRA